MSFVEKSKVISKASFFNCFFLECPFQWFNLEACKHGAIYLKVFWCQLSTVPVGRPIPFENEWKMTSQPVHSTLMVVFIDNVKGLPYPKSNVEPSPMLEVSLGTVKQVGTSSIESLIQT